MKRHTSTKALIAGLGLTLAIAGCTPPAGGDNSNASQPTAGAAGSPAHSGGTNASGQPAADGHTDHTHPTSSASPAADGHTDHSHATSSASPMMMEHNMGTKSMEALESASGKDFNIAFLSQMIAHHQGAIDMAKQTLTVAKKPETKAEAQKVIDAQTQEIAQMTGWLKDWYGAEPSAEQQALMKDDMKSMMSMPISDDNMFYQMMIPHHEGAIMMAQMAEGKSDKTELQELAAKIIADQKSEIETYRQLMGK